MTMRKRLNTRLILWASFPTLIGNNTRQGYALKSTLKPAGYFFSKCFTFTLMTHSPRLSRKHTLAGFFDFKKNHPRTALVSTCLAEKNSLIFMSRKPAKAMLARVPSNRRVTYLWGLK
ncbi:hypothetical protein ACU6TU_10055 [Halomonas sp. LS-001]